MRSMTILSRVACRIFILFVSILLICVPGEALGGQGISGASISRVAVDPSDSDVVYASSNRGIFKSTDAGESWFEINDGLPPHPDPSEVDPSFSTTLDVRAFAVAPSGPQIIYAGIFPTFVLLRDGRFIQVEGGFFTSVDGGNQWFAPGGYLPASALAVDPGDPDAIYAAAGTFYKTIDGGANWLSSRLPAGAGQAAEIALDPRDSGTIYLGSVGGTDITANGIYKSLNRGDDWFESDEGFPVQYSRLRLLWPSILRIQLLVMPVFLSPASVPEPTRRRTAGRPGLRSIRLAGRASPSIPWIPTQFMWGTSTAWPRAPMGETRGSFTGLDWRKVFSLSAR